MRRLVVLVACLTVSACGGTTVVGGDAVPAGASGNDLAGVTIAAEAPRAGYDRDLFEHWVDADGDRCHTRCEVLVAEQRTGVVAGATEGRGWYSPYDNYSTNDASELDIDHVVALAEAWDSGAFAWDAARRRAFANDLDDPRSLIAVTAASNRAKSDKDPAEWLPSNAAATCGYLRDWVAVKVRWGLSMDPGEHAVVARTLASCPPEATLVNALMHGTVAGGPNTAGGPDDAPSATGPYWPNCAAARAAGAAPLRPDSPGWRPQLDGDGDGVACE